MSMHTSRTNCYSMKVYVGGKMMVAAANDWTARLRRLPAEDAEWVQANSMHLFVTAPMWEIAPMEELPLR